MEPPRIVPLSGAQAIVDAEGRPTPFFIRQWLEARNVNVTVGEVEDSLNTLIEMVQNLVIDDLGDVDTSTTPPASGEGLIWNGAEWAPGVAGGGLLQAQVLARISLGV